MQISNSMNSTEGFPGANSIPSYLIPSSSCHATSQEHLCDKEPGASFRCQAVSPSQGGNQCRPQEDCTEREASCLKLLLLV